MSDVFTPDERSAVMSRVRSRDTGPELRVAALLRAEGARFRRHVRRLPGTPDFVLMSSKTVVFVHGCFWHGHGPCGKGARLPVTRREFWRAKIARNRARDRKAAGLLRDLGFCVLTIWECALKVGRLPPRLVKRLHSTTAPKREEGVAPVKRNQILRRIG